MSIKSLFKGKRFIVLIAMFTLLYVLYYFESGLDKRFYLTMLLTVGASGIIYVFYIFIDAGYNKIIPWKGRPILRLIIELFTLLIISLACLNLLFILLKDQFTDTAPTNIQLIVLNGYSALFLLPIFSISYTIKIIKNWQNSVLENEKIQKENMHTELMSLRNHLDPHFLFNNLNVLSSLIDIDHELSQKYLENFALVYRNILQKRNDELIPLEEEVELINHYIFLLKIRFGEGVIFNIDISEMQKSLFIPPLTLQILIENCIKHNTTDKTNPLIIDVKTTNNDEIIIRNNLQERFDNKSSNKSGLLNIESRFKYYSDKNIEINKTTTSFEVNIPLINVDTL